MRTSLTHPLMIAEIQSKLGQGLIGLTFCPGKHQPDAMTGGWDRDLDLDLDAIVTVSLRPRHWRFSAASDLDYCVQSHGSRASILWIG
jgi:hypothetical protein